MFKQTDTTEKGLETHIVQYLVAENGYLERSHAHYDKMACLDKALFFQFLAATQPKAVAQLQTYHQAQYESKILYRLNEQIRAKGIIEVLRKGITDGFTGTKLQVFYDKPVSVHNAEAHKLYEGNFFSVMRQVYYAPNEPKSLDLMLFVNGIPVVTMELKNPLTQQTVQDAIQQYKKDRNPNDEIFKFNRLLVHFAVDTEQIWMCTHLKKEKSYFMPFNQGYQNGAGNPPKDGIATDYLWKSVLTKTHLTQLIQQFVTYLKKEEKLIFPRYHQWDVVRQLLKDAQQKGTGQKYLIQHSAGSGKSNSIAWLTHQLIGLHDTYGKNNLFDTVIVVTDRRILDTQIRNTIKSFHQVPKLIEAITEGSKQLKTALEAGKKIIITTIQKFPHIVEEMGELPSKNFAIIIDEAHSSLSGNLARKLNLSLSGAARPVNHEAEEADLLETEDHDTITEEDLITDLIKSSKLLPNASYFAFTATPKNKTLELFGLPFGDGDQTKFRAFHLYSMKQAIEEGFIIDVLQNYTTYQSYYALLKKIEDDPEYDTQKAQKRLKAFVESHEHAIQKKTKLIIEHFMAQVVQKKRLGGFAKAMLVTSSRANAVQYKKKFDAYLMDIHSPYKSIVAFSGEIDGQTEASLNGFSSNEIAINFEKTEFRFLIVANKFQTGFDQPLLHTMYVDKKLGGVNAVQTLSRLNRSHPLKQETFILDFANTAEAIEKAFQPYFESTILSGATDPNKLFDLQDALDAFQVYDAEQVRAFAHKILAKESIESLHGLLNEAASVFRKQLDETEQADFRVKLKTYNRLYIFISQILPFENLYLEQLYIFLKHLQNKLGLIAATDDAQTILKHIDMDSYRLQLEATTRLVMEAAVELQPIPTQMKGSKKDTEIDKLSNILQIFNDRYGTKFESVDKVRQIVESVAKDVAQSQVLKNAIQYSDEQNARITNDKIVGDALLKHISTNFDLYKKYSDDQAFKADFSAIIFNIVKDIVKTNSI